MFGGARVRLTVLSGETHNLGHRAGQRKDAKTTIRMRERIKYIYNIFMSRRKGTSAIRRPCKLAGNVGGRGRVTRGWLQTPRVASDAASESADGLMYNSPGLGAGGEKYWSVNRSFAATWMRPPCIGRGSVWLRLEIFHWAYLVIVFISICFILM
jgi:hypothetical protein